MAKAKPTQTTRGTRRVIYPGTFDPITNGHIDMIERSLEAFDEVIVLVAHSLKKKPVFDATVRKKLIEECFKKNPRVKVEIYDGLLAEYAKKHGIHAVLRGLRVVSDFEYEFQMATMNRKMNPKLQTFFLMASDHFFFVNSTLVKEVFSLGGSVKDLVPPHVEKKMREVLC
jgi:pantetheine-phosphate adenylyltransferase